MGSTGGGTSRARSRAAAVAIMAADVSGDTGSLGSTTDRRGSASVDSMLSVAATMGSGTIQSSSVHDTPSTRRAASDPECGILLDEAVVCVAPSRGDTGAVAANPLVTAPVFLEPFRGMHLSQALRSLFEH